MMIKTKIWKKVADAVYQKTLMLIIPLKTLIIIQKLQKLKIKDVILVIQSKKEIIIQKLSIFKRKYQMPSILCICKTFLEV